MHAGLILLCLAATAYSMPNKAEGPLYRLRFDPYMETWATFKTDHGKNYESDQKEEAKRRDIFMSSLKKIEQHNWKYYNGEKSYYLGINQFADMTAEEYMAYNKLKAMNKTVIKCSQFMPPLNFFLPTKVDWRSKGYVTPVKNQGMCGSCWSFSTTGSLEGQHFRKTGELVSLSEQQLVDCSSTFGNMGCNGGLMDDAFEYINNVGGLERETDYPYEAQDEPCKFNKGKIVADLTACKDIPHESEDMLTKAVASVGPVSVAIDAGHNSFQLYSGGVYDEPDCSQTQLDHGVLVVGYGSLQGKDYWLVKNSWGTSWGSEGYIMMSRNKDNQCGIASSASFPVV
ncbi:hypothetical protein ACOMHN_055407 [Nucella lapillus]